MRTRSGVRAISAASVATTTGPTLAATARSHTRPIIGAPPISQTAARRSPASVNSPIYPNRHCRRRPRRPPVGATRPRSRRCATDPTRISGAPGAVLEYSCFHWGLLPSTTVGHHSRRICWHPAASRRSTRARWIPAQSPTLCVEPLVVLNELVGSFDPQAMLRYSFVFVVPAVSYSRAAMRAYAIPC